VTAALPGGFTAGGVACGIKALPEIEVNCDLRIGGGAGEILSADLTHAYVHENMGHS
jgi:N-acetylglutamate synthase/N-acetylornithine aminotransferase